MQKKICCFTGSRPQNMPWKRGSAAHRDFLLRLEDEILLALEAGYNHFISGMALGVDLEAVNILLDIRTKVPKRKFTVEAALPCATQAARWNSSDKNMYEYYLQRIDKVTLIQKNYTPDCYQKRNEYMVDKSSLVIGAAAMPEGGTANTLIYALRRGKEIKIVYPTNSEEGGRHFLELLKKIAANPARLREKNQARG